MNSSDPGWNAYLERRLAEHKAWQEREADRLGREIEKEIKALCDLGLRRAEADIELGEE